MIYCAVFVLMIISYIFLLDLNGPHLTLNQINSKVYNKCWCNKGLISYEKLTEDQFNLNVWLFCVLLVSFKNVEGVMMRLGLGTANESKVLWLQT
jgi:hypothetical protein